MVGQIAHLDRIGQFEETASHVARVVVLIDDLRCQDMPDGDKISALRAVGRHADGLRFYTLRENYPLSTGRPAVGRLWPDGLQRQVLFEHAGTIRLPRYGHPTAG